MKVGKKILLVFVSCILSMYVASAQEGRQEDTIDSIKVTLYDFNSSTFFNYYYYTPNHVLVSGEKTNDSISRIGRLESYKMYHVHKKLRWDVLTLDTIALFVNYAILFVSDTTKSWIVDCEGHRYETDKIHLDVLVCFKEKQLKHRIVFEPNCTYDLFINNYVAFLRRLGWL